MLFMMMCSLLVSCESRRFVVNDLDEKEANEILVFLSSKGISALKVQAIAEGAGSSKGTRWNISVEESRANEAMALLNQVGLPRRRGQNLLGIFSNSSLVPSGMQEKIRYQAGLAEQIASTIRKIDGILDAEVQISFPEEDPLNPLAQKQKITASVFVSHSGVLDDPNAYLVTRLKRLVAGSVPGLDIDNVTVIGDRARSSETPIGGFQSLNEEERPYVRLWSVVIAKDSLGRFQTIFFSFTIAIVLLVISLIWMLWKILPVLKERGGFRKLFSFHPLAEKPEGKKGGKKGEKEGDSEDEAEDSEEASERND
jgi:type III secretion protein J